MASCATTHCHSEPKIQEQRPFFTRVESVRGLAALAVAGYHLSGYAVHGVPLLPHTVWEGVGAFQNALGRFGYWLLPGHAALMIFFVISGFVLRISLRYGPQNFSRAVLRFLVARTFRIYPIVAFGAFVYALAGGWQVMARLNEPAQRLSTPTFIANILLLDVSLNSPLWALQVEILMIPAILALYFLERLWGARSLAVIALVTTFLSFAGSWVLWPPLSINFFVFVLGMLVPTFGRELASGLSQRAVNGLALLTLLILFSTGQIVGFYSRFGTVIEAYAAFVFVSIIAYRLDLRGAAVLDTKPLRRLGLSSGSYYVLHSAIFAWAVTIAALVVPLAMSLKAPVLAGFLIMTVCLAAAVPLALLSYHIIEAPGIACGRRIIAMLRSPTAV